MFLIDFGREKKLSKKFDIVKSTSQVGSQPFFLLFLSHLLDGCQIHIPVESTQYFACSSLLGVIDHIRLGCNQQE